MPPGCLGRRQRQFTLPFPLRTPAIPHRFLICLARWEKRSVLAVSEKHETVGDTVGMMTAGVGGARWDSGGEVPNYS